MQNNRRPLPVPLKISIYSEGKEVFHQQFVDFPIIIGRSENCDVPLRQFDFISRQHCVVTVEEEKLCLVDLQSANGFFADGEKTEKSYLNSESQISIGSLRVLFEFPEGEPQQGQLPEAPPSSDTLVMAYPDPPKPEIQEAVFEVKNQAIAEFEQGFDFDHDPGSVVAENFVKPETIIEKVNFSGIEVIQPHSLSATLKPNQRTLEGYVLWKDQVYDSQNFIPETKVNIGSDPYSSLHVPAVSNKMDIAYYNGENALCLIPNGATAEVYRENKTLKLEDLLTANAVTKSNSGYILKLENQDVFRLFVTDTTSVCFRYIPKPKELTKRPMVDPEEEIKKYLTISGIVHLILLMLLLILAPDVDAPKIKNVPKRYAKLLVKPPSKLVEKKKKIKKKKPVKKVKPKPKKKVQKKPKKKIKVKKVPKKINKFPLKVKQPPKVVAKKPKKQPVKDVTNIGPLSFLKKVAPAKNQNNLAININKDAGGSQKSLKTSNIVSNLKTKSGKLAGAGAPGVKTKGLGVGSGKGIGIQGLSGGAGKQGIKGAVVGTPSITEVSKAEGLTQKQVMDVVKKHLAKIQRCYERSLFDNPELKGRVEYEWDISAAGKVQGVRVKKSEVSGGDALNACVKKVFFAMRFPKAKNGQSTTPNIGFPFGRL